MPLKTIFHSDDLYLLVEDFFPARSRKDHRRSHWLVPRKGPVDSLNKLTAETRPVSEYASAGWLVRRCWCDSSSWPCLFSDMNTCPGLIPSKLGNLTVLLKLDLFCNKLTGETNMCISGFVDIHCVCRDVRDLFDCRVYGGKNLEQDSQTSGFFCLLKDVGRTPYPARRFFCPLSHVANNQLYQLYQLSTINYQLSGEADTD